MADERCPISTGMHHIPRACLPDEAKLLPNEVPDAMADSSSKCC